MATPALRRTVSPTVSCPDNAAPRIDAQWLVMGTFEFQDTLLLDVQSHQRDVASSNVYPGVTARW